MNNPMSPKKTTRAAQVLLALLTGFFLIPTLHAQPAAQSVDNRFLFIFDTSADMKKRVPALQKALNTMLATSVNGQLHSGDSIGVWTFDEDLQTGQFPLQHWDSDNAAMIASNMTKFVEKQHYSKKTSFDALQPLLNQVVENSERLTVLIFCDGEAAISGTRFDNGINQVFQQRQAELKKARQSFIVAFRAQLGEYTGCTVSFPPASLNLPKFPPWPPPPVPAPAMPQPTNAPPPASAVVVPSIIIVGTNVGTRLLPTPTNTPPPAPAVVASVNVTNAVPTPPTNSAARTNVVGRTNIVALPPENSGLTSKRSMAIGAFLLIAAGGVTALMAFLRARKTDRSSIISRSMTDRK
jgi:hypothetical protein